jgi:hypothetical protein
MLLWYDDVVDETQRRALRSHHLALMEEGLRLEQVA